MHAGRQRLVVTAGWKGNSCNRYGAFSAKVTKKKPPIRSIAIRFVTLQFVPCMKQGIQGSVSIGLLNEYVVGVVGRDGEDGNAITRERLDKRQQYSGQREREWALELEADPAVG